MPINLFSYLPHAYFLLAVLISSAEKNDSVLCLIFAGRSRCWNTTLITVFSHET